MCFVIPLIFSFVYILQLGDDLWPHSREGSEKPITKDFQFSHFTKSDWLFWNAGINRNLANCVLAIFANLAVFSLFSLTLVIWLT